MLKVNRGGCQLTRLDPRSMADADMRERSDLQRLIYANSSQFFKDECRDDLFVLNEEVSPSDFVADRIDLLAIDSYGATVIIELKRGSDKLQLLQALSYAAMVSGLTWKEVESKAAPERLQALRQFLADNGLDEDDEEGPLGLNLSQRVILIAESYDYEVLCTAQWLTDKWGLNITCYSVALARDVASGTDYLSAVQLFPAKPLAAYARQRGSQRGQVTNEPKTLERRLATSENQAISSFFSELLLQNPHAETGGGHRSFFQALAKFATAYRLENSTLECRSQAGLKGMSNSGVICRKVQPKLLRAGGIWFSTSTRIVISRNSIIFWKPGWQTSSGVGLVPSRRTMMMRMMPTSKGTIPHGRLHQLISERKSSTDRKAGGVFAAEKRGH
jgi:hypothetical protein